MKKRIVAFVLTVLLMTNGIPISSYAEQNQNTADTVKESEMQEQPDVLEKSETEEEAEAVDKSETEEQTEASTEGNAEEQQSEAFEEREVEGQEQPEVLQEAETLEQVEVTELLSQEEQEQFAQKNRNAIADGCYTIRSAVNQAFVVDVTEGKTTDGANVQLYRYNETKAQVWKVSHDAEGYVVLVNEKSGKALDVRNASSMNGTNVWQYTANGTDAQKWIAVKQPSGCVVLHSALNTNYVLDLYYGQVQNRQNIQIYQENGTTAQQWKFDEYNENDILAEKNRKVIEDGVYSIRSRTNMGYALDVVGGGTASGANIQLYNYNETKAQAWRISHDEKGYVTLINVKSGKALDVKNASASNRTNICQYDTNGTIAQKWIALKQQNGSIVFASALDPGYVLDLDCGEAKNGQNIQLYQNNNTKAQQWVLQVYDEASILAAQNRNVIADGVYSIRSQAHTGYALDVSSAGTKDGTNVQLYQYNGSKAQLWKISHDSAGYVILTNVNSGKVLDVKEGRTSDETNVQQYQYNGSRAQKWIAVKQSDGSITLLSALTAGIALDLHNGVIGNWQNVQIFHVDGTQAQKWIFKRHTNTDDLANANRGTIGAGTYAIRSAVNQSYTLDVKNGSKDNGANVQVYGYNRTNAQVWKITEDVDGYLTIENYKSGKVLDVKNGQAVNRANVQQYDANGTAAQKWIAIRQSDGSVKFVSALNPQLCLDLDNGTVSNGQNIQIYTSNNTKAQRWFVTGARPLQASPLNTKVVVLDPGHNARFTGAYYYNRQEHVMTLKVAQACKTYLESHYQNIEVYMTRETAAPLGNTIGDDLWARVELADQKNADILVSMHFNALNGSQDGALCFVSGQQNVASQCQKLGNAILGKLQGLGLRNRGNQVTASKDYPGEDYYAINRLSARYGIPGIIVEHCFMDNAHDQIYIQSDAALQRLGYADAQGIAAYFGQ